MIFPKLTDDLSIISKLGDNPGADDGLTAEGLKSKFDEAALILQAYLNGTLVETLNQLFAGGASTPNSGLNMTGPINMNNNPLQNVRDPQSAHEAINLAFANETYVSKTRKINGKALDSDISLSADDVGARGSTWFPTTAEIGAVPTSEFKQHAESRENPHKVTAAQVGATTMTLMWENASPTSEFAAQTIKMTLDANDSVMIQAGNAGENIVQCEMICPVGKMMALNATAGTQQAGLGEVQSVVRGVTVTTTGVVFQGGRAGVSSFADVNQAMVPFRIYQIKGVQK